MKLATTLIPAAGKVEPYTYIVFKFAPDEMRYLASHLNGSQPKLTFEGTIGQGLTLWAEAKGASLSDVGDFMEAKINSAHIGGYQGKRPPVIPSYERVMKNSKPAIRLAPVIAYDRDADKLALFKSPFNTALPLPKAPAAAEPPKAEPAPAPLAAPPKPALSRDEIAAVVARHSAPKAAPDLPAPPISRPIAAIPIIAHRADARGVADIKELAAMMNEALAAADDLIIEAAPDRRSVAIKRVRVIEEALAP